MIHIGDNGLADFDVERNRRRLCEAAIEYCEGNLSWAAEELGVARMTLRNWIREWGLVFDHQGKKAGRALVKRGSVEHQLSEIETDVNAARRIA